MEERIGLTLDQELQNRIRGMIHRQESRFIKRYSNIRTLHEVVIEGKRIRVVWDKLHKTVRTVFPD